MAETHFAGPPLKAQVVCTSPASPTSDARCSAVGELDQPVTAGPSPWHERGVLLGALCESAAERPFLGCEQQ